MKKINILIAILVLVSCNKEANTEDNRPEYVKWEVLLPQDISLVQIKDPIIRGDFVIVPVSNQGVLLCLDKLTGEEVWRWTEARDTYPGADGFGRWSYVYDDILVIGHNNLTYGIQISTGNTLWHNRDELSSISIINGLDDLFTRVYYIPDEHYEIRVGSVYDGEMETIFSFDREDEYNAASGFPVLINSQNQKHVAFTKEKWLSNIEGYEEIGWLHLVNIENKQLEWISDTIPKTHTLAHTPGLPVFNNDKIMLCNNSIYAYDIENGNLTWWNDEHANIFSGSTELSTADNKVFGNNENQYMVALDVDTGEELWRTTTGGTGSRIEYYDGKCYITEVTKPDGYSYFMVLDATTGEVLHNIESPYEVYGENNWYWDDKITVDQETGLIYMADHNKLICVELD